jgi:hypothetical protein
LENPAASGLFQDPAPPCPPAKIGICLQSAPGASRQLWQQAAEITPISALLKSGCFTFRLLEAGFILFAVI